MAARIIRLKVDGFRCLDGLDLGFEPLTALIGANGAGKSSVLRAVQFVFGQISLDDNDSTDGEVGLDVRVEATFADLPISWSERLSPWLDTSGNLVVARQRTNGADDAVSEFWSASRLQAPGFAPVRAGLAVGASVAELKPLWVDAQSAVGDELPNWTTKQAAAEMLDNFEATHPELLSERVADRSLRFGPGGAHDLSTMIELLLLPAMRDAADDAAESRGSTLGRLVDLTVRAGMGLDERLSELTEKTAQAYDELLADAAGTRLDDLSANITAQLGSFAPGAQVTLAWERRPPVLAAPPVRARIVESGHEADIGRQGHGVQRAYVFSLLRALLDARRAETTSQPSLVLAVEEPEAYQHPLRARYVARVLEGLANDEAAATQVIYTTHSPYLVSVENIASVRTLRMEAIANEHTLADNASVNDLELDLKLSPDPTISIDGSGANAGTALRRRTRATSPALADIAARLDLARAGSGKKWTAEKVAAQLPGLLGVGVSEGLFADAVVLVEGVEDVGILSGAADAASIDLAEFGVALIPVGGKAQLPLAMETFRAAGVPVYVVFDTDEDKNDPGSLLTNAMITALASGVAKDRPGTHIEPTHATFSPNLRALLDSEIGAEPVKAAFVATAIQMGLPESTTKNGHLARSVIRDLLVAGQKSGTVTSLVHTVREFGSRSVRRSVSSIV